MTIPVLKLKRGEDRRLRAGHLWIFSNEVDTAATPLTQFEPGAAVQVHSDRDQFLGHAYVNPRTLIAARIVGRDPAYPLDASLLVHRLRVALALRERLYREPYYRLVYGESDGLPGLVLDRYGDVVVAQSGTAGIDRLRAEVEAAVRQGDPREDHRVEERFRRARARRPATRRVAGGSERRQSRRKSRVREQGVDFVAPLADGQKTGWFYDQAANRERLRRYLPRRCARARRVQLRRRLGRHRAQGRRRQRHLRGFLGHRARLRRAQCARPMASTVETIKDDAFDALKALQESGARFDVVILDPPAFAKRKKDVPQAQAAYRKLNQLALPLIDRDGLLVSCSCSYHMGADELVDGDPDARRDTPAASCRFWSWAASRRITRCTRPFPRPAT